MEPPCRLHGQGWQFDRNATLSSGVRRRRNPPRGKDILIIKSWAVRFCFLYVKIKKICTEMQRHILFWVQLIMLNMMAVIQ